MKNNIRKGWIEEVPPEKLKRENNWAGQLSKCYRYKEEYVALTRELDTEWGKVIHCCFRNTKGTYISWSEKQWLKNSLFGDDRTAIEVFPQQDRLIDEVNMYHLWVFERDYELPFGIHSRDKSERREKYER